MSKSSRPPSSAPAAPVPTDASLEAMLAKAFGGMDAALLKAVEAFRRSPA